VRVLAVDPGREKCGVAVVDERDGILARGVIPTGVVATIARDWARAHRPTLVIIGNGTSSRVVRGSLSEIELPVQVVPETNTTWRARGRYFEENPPRGWRRLIPRGLQTPPVPVDDYAAILIAEDYLGAEARRAAEDYLTRNA